MAEAVTSTILTGTLTKQGKCNDLHFIIISINQQRNKDNNNFIAHYDAWYIPGCSNLHWFHFESASSVESRDNVASYT